MAIEYRGKISYPPLFDEAAQIIGRQRMEYNNERRAKVARYDRGSEENNLRIDSLGIWGELVFSYYLTSKGIQHECQRLLSDNPIADWDVKINGKTIDVKAFNPKRNSIIISHEAHLKKPMDFYAFVQPAGDYTAHVWVASYADVNKWEVKTLNPKYGPAIVKDVSYE